ncbi:hypothetical protein N7462_002692 [Penicillium macrosclerotiorum]|uniref:uncharacterized protein n=1 Tax=Penicillium macrosclerotiorum TaxID=303699 RepID=UPI002548C8C2|nr:uncharacterized protein N7462_002692 [Penicillium macrosclerotiorum]KAJ5693269.1 hypothetical protein N7462_002692 [Penicillium macrosclerotiorum]
MAEPTHPEKAPGQSLSSSLHAVLTELHRRPYPHVPNPPACKKRASVALILRIKPTYEHWPCPTTEAGDPSRSVEERLEDFFAQPWVQHGDPEVLFIKRASRVGDRWTGHVALPGGKRDPEDADDREAAIREASEEIGLDLTTDDTISVGNLPERVVTTSWGSVPLMVLCPFVFITTRMDSPTLKLQPTEVASTHWIPLRALLSPSLRTVEYVDLSQRFAQQGGFLTRMLVRSLLGWMQFSAVRLLPSESQHCTSIPGFVPDGSERDKPSLVNRFKTWCLSNQADSGDRNRPLLLWGLTLGVLADFLDMLPPHTAVQLWKYPTFTSQDLGLIVSILTYNLRKRNAREVKMGARPSDTAVDSETAAVPVTSDANGHDHNEVGIGGLGVGRYYGPGDRGADGTSYAVGIMLRGYYQRLRMAIIVFLAWRMTIGSAAVFAAWRFYRRRLQ